jgi:hypothetical protein
VKLGAMAPLARCAAVMLALIFVVSGAVLAEPVFPFDAAPGKLPKTVVPISYSIERPQNPRAAGDRGMDIEAWIRARK